MKNIKAMDVAEIADLIQNKAEFWLDRKREVRDAVADHLRDIHEHQTRINKFLNGESDLNGYWFGETPPGAPPFWWRKHLTITPKDNP